MKSLDKVTRRVTRKDGKATELTYTDISVVEEGKKSREVKDVIVKVIYLEGLEEQAAEFLRAIADKIDNGDVTITEWQ